MFKHIILPVLAIGLFAQAASAQVTRVSVATDGTQGNGGSSRARLSGNGRFVVFDSTASNLVANDTNNSSDVFVRDLVAHTTTRVSIASDGTERLDSSFVSDISDDGRYVAFVSSGGFVPGATKRCTSVAGPLTYCADVYVHDRNTGQTERVSVASDGAEGNSHSNQAAMSGDGRYVVFTTAASNLAPGDTNENWDIYLRDRTAQTTTRVSVGVGGRQGASESSSAAISKDGRVVAFVSKNNNFTDAPSGNCESCYRVFVRTLGDDGARQLKMVNKSDVFPFYSIDATVPVLSAGGRYVAVTEIVHSGHVYVDTNAYVHEVASDTVLPVSSPGIYWALSDDGRFAASSVSDAGPGTIADQRTGLIEPVPGAPLLTQPVTVTSFDATGRYVVFNTIDPDRVPDDTNGMSDVFLVDRDPDGDGMPSYWETRYGLNPANGADASADADGDGVTNLQEFQNGGVPTGIYKRYFAEGVANSFFATRVAVANPENTMASVSLQLLGSGGQQTTRGLQISGKARRTFFVNYDLPDSVFAMVLESDHPFVADRLTSWDATGYGSHLETSIDAPGLSWYFAEGATGGPYSLYYLLQNPGVTDAPVTVTYLRPSPLAPITKTYTVPARSRKTIDVRGEDPALAAAEVSASITAAQPIVAERAMYYSTPTQFQAAGHDGAGIATPAARWFLAEGATGFFDEYVLIANPDDTSDANVTVTYLLENGDSFTDPAGSISVKKQSRLTLDLKARDARLHDAVVSVVVESTNAVPVVVERVMWWPHGSWYEASLSAGTTTAGTRWAVAEGEQGGTQKASTYLLIANTDVTGGTATVTLLYDGASIESKTFNVDAQRRFTVDIGAEFPNAKDRTFGILVESNGPQIVVERSFYTSPGGVTFAAGGTSVATKLPVVQ